MKKLFLLIVLMGCQNKQPFHQFESKYIEVTIRGEIKNPNTYQMENHATIKQLIQKAGGLTKAADEKSIDFFQRLKDQDHIIIFRKKDNKININTANEKQLQSLNGIGKTLAKRIIEYRKNNGLFKNKNDLLKVKGMHAKKLEKFISEIQFE